MNPYMIVLETLARMSPEDSNFYDAVRDSPLDSDEQERVRDDFVGLFHDTAMLGWDPNSTAASHAHRMTAVAMAAAMWYAGDIGL